MNIYQVSNWVYFGLFIGCAAVGIGTAYAAKFGLPALATIAALWFAWLFVPIVGTMIGGALVPGKPVANMYFSAYGYTPVVQSYSDLKIGQYTKLPPRATFTMQMIGTVVGGLLNFIIMTTIVTSQREPLKAVQGSNVWSGQQAQSFNSAAIALYATGCRYGVRSGFPIPFYIAHRMWDSTMCSPPCWWLFGNWL